MAVTAALDDLAPCRKSTSVLADAPGQFTTFIGPRLNFRYANRPSTTALLARVRVWLVDPVTHRKTGMTKDELVSRLEACGRLENWMLLDVDPEVVEDLSSEVEGAYGYWDEQDVEAWNRVPGRRPEMGDDWIVDDGCDTFQTEHLTLYLAFRKDAHAVTVTDIKRLTGCKLRDIVICDRANLVGVPYETQVRLWFEWFDTDYDLKHVTMGKRFEYAPGDMVQRSKEECDASCAAEPEYVYPDVVGNGLTSKNGMPTKMSWVDPLILKWSQVELVCDDPNRRKLDQLLLTKFAEDMPRLMSDEIDTVAPPAVVHSPQTGHLGRTVVSVDGSEPTHYVMNSGNGLKYELWGDMALVCSVEPDEAARAEIAGYAPIPDYLRGNLPDLQSILENRRYTALPYAVLIGALPWAFPGVTLEPNPELGATIAQATENTDDPTFSQRLYAALWLLTSTVTTANGDVSELLNHLTNSDVCRQHALRCGNDLASPFSARFIAVDVVDSVLRRKQFWNDWAVVCAELCIPLDEMVSRNDVPITKLSKEQAARAYKYYCVGNLIPHLDGSVEPNATSLSI